MKKVKNDVKFLLESGLLFEINRLVLQKFGYALVIDIDHNNRRKPIIAGLYEPNEPDDEGFLFDEEAFNDGYEKYQTFLELEGNEKLRNREKALGYIIQEKNNE